MWEEPDEVASEKIRRAISSLNEIDRRLQSLGDGKHIHEIANIRSNIQYVKMILEEAHKQTRVSDMIVSFSKLAVSMYGGVTKGFISIKDLKMIKQMWAAFKGMGDVLMRRIKQGVLSDSS